MCSRQIPELLVSSMLAQVEITVHVHVLFISLHFLFLLLLELQLDEQEELNVATYFKKYRPLFILCYIPLLYAGKGFGSFQDQFHLRRMLI